jgi:adenine-specific DNA-methyltransferase
VRALEVSADDALIAFVTPREWLDVNYGRAVKALLLDRATVEGMVVLDTEHLFFNGVITTAAITLIRKGSPTREATRIVHVPRELAPADQVLAALAGEQTSLKVNELQFAPNMKWSRPAQPKRPGAKRSTVVLSEIARVRRGVATGCNSFFVLSEARRLDLNLPLSALKSCLASPKLVHGDCVTVTDLAALPDDARRWLIDVDDPGAIDRDDDLGRYLRHGRDNLKVHETYLAGSRARGCPVARRT